MNGLFYIFFISFFFFYVQDFLVLVVLHFLIFLVLCIFYQTLWLTLERRRAADGLGCFVIVTSVELFIGFSTIILCPPCF